MIEKYFKFDNINKKRLDLDKEIYNFFIDSSKIDGSLKDKAIDGLHRLVYEVLETRAKIEDGELLQLKEDQVKIINKLKAFDICVSSDSCLDNAIKAYYDSNKKQILDQLD